MYNEITQLIVEKILHFTLMLAWCRHVQHIRVFFVDEKEGAIVDSAETHQQVTNFRDWIHRSVVSVRSWIRKLLKQIFFVLFLQ